MKIVFTTLLFFVLVTQALAGLFVGVAIVDGGLVILRPSEAGVGSGRIVKQVRLELGDKIQVGDDGICRLCFIDGTTVNLSPDSEYRIKREGLWKVLDGGEMIVADFRLTLGSKTQRTPVTNVKVLLGELIASGHCEYKNSNESEWGVLSQKKIFSSGGVIRTGSDGRVIITYNQSTILAMIGPDSLVYCLKGGVNFERGKGLFSISSGDERPIFDASMSRIRVRTKKAVFYFQELKDGARLSVYKGRLQLALKTQGLPRSVTIGSGSTTRLQRSGLIERPQKFKIPANTKEIDQSINAMFAKNSFDELTAFINGSLTENSPGNGTETPLKRDSIHRASGSPQVNVPVSGTGAADLPTAGTASNSSGASSDSVASSTEIPSGAAADLEKLFQLPRMDKSDRNRARP